MFQTVASLFLFGALSPMSPGAVQPASELSLLQISSLPTAMQIATDDSLSASGVIVMDLESGKEVFGVRADQRRPVGSLVKLMTADVILKHHALNERVVVPWTVQGVQGNVAGLQAGEEYSVRDLLTALLIHSGNDAALTLAVHHSGSTKEFAEAMNERAEALGLRSTNFENPIGYDEVGQFSTPRDLAWMAMYAWKHPVIRSLAGRTSAEIQDHVTGRIVTLRNTNNLLYSHPGIFYGLKTGTTDGAGECLISLGEVGGRSYIFVVLMSSDRYRDTLALFDSLAERVVSADPEEHARTETPRA